MLTSPGTGRPARGLILLLLACVPLLSGYVLPPAKVLQRWFRDGPRPTVVLPALLPARFQGRDAQLYLDPAGTHALAVGGVLYSAAVPSGNRGGAEALWRSLDLLLATAPEVAMGVMEAAGVQSDRGGYARADCSSDGVAHTLGALGEGEAELPQVWFSRSPLRPCRVRLGDEVEVGPPSADGWPSWFRLGSDVLELTGGPVPALARPAWAVPAAPSFAPPGSAPLGDWRRAFDPIEP